MQRYLNSTGELHNNVRMTWGKTAMSWLSEVSGSADDVIQGLALLNDKYALDGFSPPSYGGILWCVGWGDKPGRDGGISMKWSSSYKMSSVDFDLARQRLLGSGSEGGAGSKAGEKRSLSIAGFFSPTCTKRVVG